MTLHNGLHLMKCRLKTELESWHADNLIVDCFESKNIDRRGRIQVSEDGDQWKEVHCGRVFDANSDKNTKVKNLFDVPVKGRWVRIFPQTW